MSSVSLGSFFTVTNFAAIALGYLLGTIPFGLILTKIAGAPDIRGIGSGNIGATNVLRTGRKGLAATTLLLDMLKGTAAVLIASAIWGKDAAMLAGFGALIGHVFPVWLKFKGGKGVATFLGVLIGAAWPIALCFAAIWLSAAWLWRYSSLSALIASAATPVLLWFFIDRRLALVFLIMAAIVVIMHRANIARLRAGTESRIGASAVTS